MKIIHWIQEESLRVLPAVVYFTIAFNLIHFTTGLALQPDDVRYFTYVSVTIGALIVGKILIIANYLPFVNAFPQKPLIYNIVWKLVLYNIFMLVLWIVHNSLHLMFHHHTFSMAIERIWREFFSPIFLATELWLWVTFFIFVTATEFVRVIGKNKILNLLFG